MQTQHSKPGRLAMHSSSACLAALHEETLRRTYARSHPTSFVKRIEPDPSGGDQDHSGGDLSKRDAERPQEAPVEATDGQDVEHHAEDVQRQEDADGAVSTSDGKATSRTATTAVSHHSVMSAPGIRRTQPASSTIPSSVISSSSLRRNQIRHRKSMQSGDVIRNVP